MKRNPSLSLRGRIIIAILAGLIVACKTDPVQPVPIVEWEEPSCFDLPQLAPEYNGWKAIFPQYLRIPQGISPINSDNLLYLRKNQDTRLLELYRHTISTGESVFIRDHVANARWSSKDWICFEDVRNRQLYKMKSNGDSLTQLTFEDRNWNPEWHPDGTKLIFLKDKVSPRAIFRIIMDEQGVVLDTLPIIGHQETNQVSWSPDGKKIAVHYFSLSEEAAILAYYKYPEKTFHQVTFNVTELETGWMDGFDWGHDSRSIYFSNYLGILKLDIQSGQISRIRPDCQNRYYTFVFTADDGSYLLGSSVNLTIVPPDTLYQELHIEQMPLDGSSLKRIDLGES